MRRKNTTVQIKNSAILKRSARATGSLASALILFATANVAQAGSGVFPSAEPKLAKDLSQLMKIDERVIAARQSLNAARSGKKQAFSVFLPNLSFSSDYGREVIDSPSGRTSGLDEQRETRRKATLTLTQNLFSGGSNSASFETSSKQVELADLNLASTKSSVLLEGLLTYFSLVRDKKLLDLASRAEVFTKEQLKLENEKVEKGKGIALDILQAKSRLQLATQRKIQFKGQLDLATTQFTYLFKFRPVLAAQDDPKFDLPKVPSSLDGALSIALKNSAALSAAQTNVDVTKLGIDSVQAGFWPQIDLETTVNYEKDAGAVKGIRRDWSVLLKATWTLFDGFGTYHGAKSARSNYAASLSQLDASKRQVKTELITSFQRLKTAGENRELMENGLRIAEEIVSARERMEKAGKETSINTLDAQSQLIDAKISYTSAFYDHLLAGLSVIFNMGLLTADDLSLGSE